MSSKSGSLRALDRENGELLWQLKTSAKIESSPVAIDNTVYFGATDGRLFAVNAGTAAVRWAYDTGGRINASPSIWGNRICISTYAGSLFCLDRRDGKKLWSKYFNRGFFRNESFYASPSTDGRRIFLVSRSREGLRGQARNGDGLWRGASGRPATRRRRSPPARVRGRLRRRAARLQRRATARELWRRYVNGRILGAPVVVGDLVFFSTLETNTYAARVDGGKIVWKIGMGKYSPGIATNEHYYFSLNGILVAFRGENSPPEPAQR